MRLVSLEGTPKAMGRAFGEACRDQIADFYQRRVENAVGQALKYGGRTATEAELLNVAERSIGITRDYDPRGWAELEGISEGSGLPVVKVLAMNGLTDFRDILAWPGELETFGGCSSFLVQRDATRDGHVLAGQTWDLATDNMPYVLGVHRKPDEGPATWCLTTVGCLSLIGMNAEGICIGTTNLRTMNARPGVNYLGVIHRVLSCSTIDEAVDAVASAPRAGAHFFYLADGEGHAVALETSPENVDRLDVGTGAHVHCNHCQIGAHRDIEADTPAASSHARQTRLEQLIASSEGQATWEHLRTYLSDRENGENAICRDDFNGISSNGAVIMEPEKRRVMACHGLPDRSEWVDLVALANGGAA